MHTRYWNYGSPHRPSDRDIAEAAALLREGRTVAFATETVYGLGGDAGSDEAIDRIYQAKGRPSDNPLIVHIADAAQLGEVADVSAETPEGRSLARVVERLVERFWPGPLTLVLPARTGAVSVKVTAGLPTVAVRMPDHPDALALIRAAGRPIAAPSANRSGRPSPTTAAHVREDLDGLIDGVLDGGPCRVGLESTVVEVGPDGALTILRPGSITPEELKAAAEAAAVTMDAAELDNEAMPRSPGMKYAHYAPRGHMIVVSGPADRMRQYICGELAQAKAGGETTGALVFAEHAEAYASAGAVDVLLTYGSVGQPELSAQQVFGALREFDRRGVTFIAAEGWEETGIGIAVMNRLRKAAGGRWIRLDR